MCILREQGRADVVGVLARALVEVWLVSLYVLLKGTDEDDNDVLVELGLSHARNMAILADRFELGDEVLKDVREWEEAIKEGEGDPAGRNSLPKLDRIARQVRDLIAKATPEETFDAISIYERVYRAESTYSAHPSVGLYVRYIGWDVSEQADTIHTNPETMFEPEVLAATLTLFLAKRVFKTFGIVGDPQLDAVLAKLCRAAEASGAQGVQTNQQTASGDPPAPA